MDKRGSMENVSKYSIVTTKISRFYHQGVEEEDEWQ